MVVGTPIFVDESDEPCYRLGQRVYRALYGAQLRQHLGWDLEIRAVYARFLGSDILGEGGRLVFSLLNPFVLCDYKALLADTVDLDASKRTDALILALKNLTVVDTIPDDTAEYIYIFITKTKIAREENGRERSM